MELQTLDFMDRLRRCEGDDSAKMTLLNWMRKAQLVLLQSRGNALSKHLVDELETMLTSVMHGISILGTEDYDNPDLVFFLQQVTEFYEWLKCQSGRSEPQIMRAWQEFQPEHNTCNELTSSTIASEQPESTKVEKRDAVPNEFRQCPSEKPAFW